MGLVIDLLLQLPEAWKDEALEGMGRIEHAEECVKLLADLITEHPRSALCKLYSLWCRLLSALAVHTRKELLSDLRALASVIHKRGGEEAITGVIHSIQDVGRWWP
jgi:hypothetical protein